ncbi:MAG: hypothetical protein Q8P02_01330 [Candidatus Micrarchaeota archaeon]|nr:hypothetical protein [Candidatus Micrarchaeota archaeon]
MFRCLAKSRILVSQEGTRHREAYAQIHATANAGASANRNE